MDFTTIFGGLTNGVTEMGASLVEAFTSVSSIFYIPGASGGLTLVGWLLLAVLAIGFVRFALNTIFKLFTRIK